MPLISRSTKEGKTALSQFLANNKTVRILYLSRCGFDSELGTLLLEVGLLPDAVSGARCSHLLQALESNPRDRLHTLILDRNPIGDAGARKLAEWLNSPKCALRHMSLNGCRIGMPGISAFNDVRAKQQPLLSRPRFADPATQVLLTNTSCLSLEVTATKRSKAQAQSQTETETMLEEELKQLPHREAPSASVSLPPDMVGMRSRGNSAGSDSGVSLLSITKSLRQSLLVNRFLALGRGVFAEV